MTSVSRHVGAVGAEDFTDEAGLEAVQEFAEFRAEFQVTLLGGGAPKSSLNLRCAAANEQAEAEQFRSPLVVEDHLCDLSLRFVFGFGFWLVILGGSIAVFGGRLGV